MAEETYYQHEDNEPGQPDWRALVNDVEQRVDSLTAALQEVRLAVRHLTNLAESQPAAPAVAAPVQAEPPRAWEPTPAMAAEEPPGPEPERAWEPTPVAMAEEPLALTEVPASLEPATAPEAPVRPALWTALPRAEEPSPAPAEPPLWSHYHEETSPADASAMWSRPHEAHEDVAPVEAPSTGAQREEPEAVAPSESPSVWNETPATTAEAVPVEMSEQEDEAPAAAEPATPAEPLDAEAMREQVRRAVAEARAEFEAGALHRDGEPMPAKEMSTPPPQPGEYAWPGQSSEPGRTWQLSGSETAAAPAPSTPTSGGMQIEPTVIVIEDPGGRVELARVFEALNRLECAGKASLLNYAPHSVSIGLDYGRIPPTPDALSAAVEAVFNRSCEVVVDGARISVRMREVRGRVA